MRWTLCVCQTAVMILVTCGVSAQTPDFSGKWSVADPPGAPGQAMGSAPPTLSAHGTMGSGWGSDITVTQDARTLTVEYTYFHPRDMQPPFVFTYLLNGTESRNTVNMGRGPQEQISRVAREGNSVVIVTIHRFVNPPDGQPMTSETRQALSLESPTTLIVETTRSGVPGGDSSVTKTTYRRQDAR